MTESRTQYTLRLNFTILVYILFGDEPVKQEIEKYLQSCSLVGYVINIKSNQIYICNCKAPYVAGESEAHNGRD